MQGGYAFIAIMVVVEASDSDEVERSVSCCCERGGKKFWSF